MAADRDPTDALHKYRQSPATPSKAAQDAAASPSPDSQHETSHTCFAALGDGLAFSIDYVFLNGSRRSIPYGYLVDVQFDPSEGLSIKYVGPTVKVRGRNLMPIYDSVRTQRAYRVIEIDARFGVAESDTAVTHIEIVEEESNSKDAP